ncbi:MAG: carbohydrate ABC transporter permease [Sphaerochaetaceae bacterium]
MKHKYTFNDFIYTVPAFLIFCTVLLVPLIMSFVTSFASWNGVTNNIKFIGFDNYRYIFTKDAGSWTSMTFSFKFTFVCVILTNFVALLLALILTSQIHRGVASTLRVVFFLPNLVGGLILGFIWRFIFLKVFPQLGQMIPVGFLTQPWLATPDTAFWGSVIVFMWRNTGYVMLVYIASLNNIDSCLLESAVIDGASYFKVLFKIKIPLIVPAITSSLFLIISRAFKLFDIIFSLTGGGPYGTTESYAYNIYYEAFKRNNYGLGSAKAVVFFLIVAAVSLLQVYVTKRKEVKYD